MKNTIRFAIAAVLVVAVSCGIRGAAPPVSAQTHADPPDFSHDHDHGHDHGKEPAGEHEKEHADGHDHGDEAPAGEHEHGEGEGHVDRVRLTPDQMLEAGIEVAVAAGGSLPVHAELTGEVRINGDRMAHIVPRVAGIVREVRKSLGDRVVAGEVMAVLDSRDLADAKSSYLAALERGKLADINHQREEGLWQKKISSEQDYLQAKQARAEAAIELRSREQSLHALGLSEQSVGRLSEAHDELLTQYELFAPFDGTVIERHITLGEVLKDESEVFLVADLSEVWVDLKVYQRELSIVRPGLAVRLSAGPGAPDAEGRIAYVGPILGERSRSALARVILPNPDGAWRPGLFVTARVVVDEAPADVIVPREALLTFEGRLSVFVETAEGFEPRQVVKGRENRTHAEVLSGLRPGERFAAKGAFILKADLGKESAEHQH